MLFALVITLLASATHCSVNLNQSPLRKWVSQHTKGWKLEANFGMNDVRVDCGDKWPLAKFGDTSALSSTPIEASKAKGCFFRKKLGFGLYFVFDQFVSELRITAKRPTQLVCVALRQVSDEEKRLVLERSLDIRKKQPYFIFVEYLRDKKLNTTSAVADLYVYVWLKRYGLSPPSDFDYTKYTYLDKDKGPIDILFETVHVERTLLTKSRIRLYYREELKGAKKSVDERPIPDRIYEVTPVELTTDKKQIAVKLKCLLQLEKNYGLVLLSFGKFKEKPRYLFYPFKKTSRHASRSPSQKSPSSQHRRHTSSRSGQSSSHSQQSSSHSQQSSSHSQPSV